MSRIPNHSIINGTNASKERDQSLLMLDDDDLFLQRMGRALEKRGFKPMLATTFADACGLVSNHPPAFAVIDMRVGADNGLDLVPVLRRARPDCRVIMLTGYGNLATAVQATKIGAVDYLAKPADADQVVHALRGRNDPEQMPSRFSSPDRVRWEHIQRVFELCNQNVSETARQLSMHRRTLQRILSKQAPV